MTAPGHDLPGKVAQLKTVIDAAVTWRTVARWAEKALADTDGDGTEEVMARLARAETVLDRAVGALDTRVDENASPWIAWALGEVANEFRESTLAALNGLQRDVLAVAEDAAENRLLDTETEQELRAAVARSDAESMAAPDDGQRYLMFQGKRAASEPRMVQDLRELLTDAVKIMAHAAQNDVEVEQRYAAWQERLRLLESGGPS